MKEILDIINIAPWAMVDQSVFNRKMIFLPPSLQYPLTQHRILSMLPVFQDCALLRPMRIVNTKKHFVLRF